MRPKPKKNWLKNELSKVVFIREFLQHSILDETVFITLDEAGFGSSSFRKYGYAERGEKCKY